VDVPSGTTLDGLVDLINKDADNLGVRASTIFDGTDHHLQIRGMDLGLDNTVTIDPDTLSWFGPFETSQAAANAQLRVDGFPSTDWIERSTNTISDVLAGVTLSLKSTTGETPVTIIVGRDDEAIKEQVRTFVSQVNEVLALTRDLMKVDPNNSTGSVLTGNYGVQIIQQNLKLILAGKGLGFDYDRDPFVSLSSIGIRTDADEGSVTRGELILDESALQAALDKDAEGLASLFSASSQVLTDSPNFVPAAEPLISGITKPGSYEVLYELDDTGNILSASIGGVAAIIDHTSRTITGASGDSRGLSLEIRNTDQGAHSGMAYVQQGKAGELIGQLKMITDPTTGTLNILEKNYQGIMNNIDIKIDFEEARLVRRERDLRHRFSRLESLLGYYDQLTSYLSSQIGSLSEKS
jgi:flagellar hook-associated protein 2